MKLYCYRTLLVLNSQRSFTKVASFSSFCDLAKNFIILLSLSLHTHILKSVPSVLGSKVPTCVCALSLGQYTLLCQLVFKLKFICCLSWYKPYTFIYMYRGKPSYHTYDIHSYWAVLPVTCFFECFEVGDWG